MTAGWAPLFSFSAFTNDSGANNIGAFVNRETTADAQVPVVESRSIHQLKIYDSFFVRAHEVRTTHCSHAKPVLLSFDDKVRAIAFIKRAVAPTLGFRLHLNTRANSRLPLYPTIEVRHDRAKPGPLSVATGSAFFSFSRASSNARASWNSWVIAYFRRGKPSPVFTNTPKK